MPNIERGNWGMWVRRLAEAPLVQEINIRLHPFELKVIDRFNGVSVVTDEASYRRTQIRLLQLHKDTSTTYSPWTQQAIYRNRKRLEELETATELMIDLRDRARRAVERFEHESKQRVLDSAMRKKLQ